MEKQFIRVVMCMRLKTYTHNMSHNILLPHSGGLSWGPNFMYKQIFYADSNFTNGLQYMKSPFKYIVRVCEVMFSIWDHVHGF